MRVKVPSPRSPVIMAVTPLSFSQPKQPPQLGAQDRVVGQPGEQRFDRVEHDALGADDANRMVEPDEQPFEIVFARLLDLAAFDANVVDDQLLSARSAVGRSKPSDATSLGDLVGVLLERHEHAGLVEAYGRR